MLAIRLQRTGRKGHAQYRMVVQDSRKSPISGKIVTNLGSFDPHTKATQLDTAKASEYLNNGAQPSQRVVSILKREGVKMPDWVSDAPKKERNTKNSEKLRKNRPAEEAPEEAPAAEASEAPAEEAEAKSE